MKDPKPLSPSLAHLVRAERHADGPPPGAEDRAWERLERSISGGDFGDGGGDPGANRTSGAMLRPRKRLRARLARIAAVLGIFALGAMVGALAMHFFGAAPETRVVYLTPSSSAPPMAEPPPPASTAPLTLEIPDEGAAAASPSATALPASRQLAGERSMLDVARAALNRGEGEEALRATDRHKARFSAGILAEEREALAIQALLLLHRTNDASQRAARFERRYPRSVLLPTIRAALAAAP